MRTSIVGTGTLSALGKLTSNAAMKRNAVITKARLAGSRSGSGRKSPAISRSPVQAAPVERRGESGRGGPLSVPSPAPGSSSRPGVIAIPPVLGLLARRREPPRPAKDVPRGETPRSRGSSARPSSEDVSELPLDPLHLGQAQHREIQVVEALLPHGRVRGAVPSRPAARRRRPRRSFP